ncbi:alpha-L-rhamnosidase [Haloterrigena salina JCM 13891]|uniref:alpha-L-rhamnosidase n=1 Tax=Haloterrigena salina JCM 13891 TaxID=1227488 RepID=M0CPW2_9EURY|nr:family 78 glycoside hydrolase catalytic domain [Haloterrigena salina]ELZ24427.1 alpha-L-rhamnosidase [Haloterrigena salina JCM 13891]
MSGNQPVALRTEYASTPIGLDAARPDLRWRVDADRRGARQTAFRVLVASTPDRLSPGEADCWDTGKRSSDRPAVTYDGDPLESGREYHWAVRVWDESDEPSAWSDPARWETGLLEPADWEASWISRPDDGAFERGQFTYLRREVSLEGEIERARAYVSASHRYELSVNGRTVDCGPSASYPDFQYYKTVGLTDDLETGANAIGALCNWNGAGQGRPAAEPGFICQLEVTFADGTERTVVTDGSWRVREAEWREDAPLRNDEIAEPIEIIDARRVPRGWNEPGFDAGAWDYATVVGTHPTEPWERLVAQRSEVVRSPIEPVSMDRLEDGSYVVDFGRVYAGLPEVRFADGTDGHRVALRAGYRLADDGSVAETEGTQWTDMRYEYVQREGEGTFRPFNYLGIRYLQIDDPGEELEPEQVGLLATRNAVPDERAATFESDDETVDAVFDLARHSALYGCQGQFVDTPTREKGQFLMDGFNVSRTTTRAFAERALSRQAIAEFCRSHYRYWAGEGRLNAVYPNGDGKRDIPDFTVSFPEWVWRYYRTTGDRATLERAYPVITAIAAYVERHVDGETGLVANLLGGGGGPYEEGIVDWPPEMRYGYDRDWPVRTTVNVLCTSALGRAADIAAELDRPDHERSHYRDRQRALEAAIDDRLRQGDRYVDGCDATDASDSASQHANALPLAFGLVPDARVDAVAERVADQGMSMGPMMVPWLLEALETAGRPDAVVDLLTNPDDDGWANIIAQGGTFTWETWHCRDSSLPDDQRHNRSESHAMGATVLVYILRTLLGVRSDGLAGERLEIRPPEAGLESASGRVPTERGPVAVSWTRGEHTDPETDDGSESFHLEATIPWNASATVVLPTSTEDAVATVDGEPVWDGDEAATLPDGVSAVRDGERLEIDVESGTYEFGFE